MKHVKLTRRQFSAGVAAGVAAAGSTAPPGQVIAQQRPGGAVGAATPGKRPNVVVIMCDDIGWGDPNAYGFDRGVRTPNLNRLAAEGVRFSNWYGQSSCTAGRASFITGRIPIRSGLSVVVAPGDPNHLRASVPTIAEFFRDNGYQTYMSGKWHLGDKPEAFPSTTASTR
jgi:arylsulfatase